MSVIMQKIEKKRICLFVKLMKNNFMQLILNYMIKREIMQKYSEIFWSCIKIFENGIHKKERSSFKIKNTLKI